MWGKRSIAVSIGSALIGIAGMTVAISPAGATDRPTNVGFVRVWHNYNLHHDGTVSVGGGLRCIPGWQSEELDILLGQDGVEGSGSTTVSIVCDNNWHPVAFTITDISGPFHPGEAQISAQFLVTNVDSGDSAGAHSQGSPTLRNRG
jgi:hypothetical protein